MITNSNNKITLYVLYIANLLDIQMKNLVQSHKRVDLGPDLGPLVGADRGMGRDTCDLPGKQLSIKLVGSTRIGTDQEHRGA